MEEDGRAEAANVVGVVGGRQPVVVAGHIFDHVFAMASVVLVFGVDDGVVVASVATCPNVGCHVHVWNGSAGIRFDAKCLTYSEVALWCFLVALAFFPQSVSAYVCRVGAFQLPMLLCIFDVKFCLGIAPLRAFHQHDLMCGGVGGVGVENFCPLVGVGGACDC